ncbi:MAG: hypothetical protein JOZ87_34500 [Chloroflexi bacterium]|nr:hypothetical protein [Chloroflexota bacterium]
MKAEALQRARELSEQQGVLELTWDDVVQVANRYEPWIDAGLVLDAIDPLEVNLRRRRAHLVAFEAA